MIILILIFKFKFSYLKKSGEAFIITTRKTLTVLRLVYAKNAVESQLINSLADNLNAEICLGNVTTVLEGKLAKLIFACAYEI